MAGTSRVMNNAIVMKSVKKKFRLYHERRQTLKEAVLAGRGSSYTELWALNDVSFEFKKGKTYGIIGENGSGKSTMLKMITRILRPDAGTVEVDGRISALLELGAGFHPELTGRENIYLNGAILRLSKPEIDKKFDDIVDFSEIRDFIDTPVKNYSSGMYMRLGFAIAVNVDPDILLIDEVLAVGDESFQKKCLEKLRSIQKSGKTIIFVSHDSESVKNLCDEALLIDDGKIAISGDVETVVNRYHAMLSSRESGAPKTPISGPDAGRYGTGEGHMDLCEINDDNGKTADTFAFGDPMRLRISATFNKDIDDPIIGVIISNEVGAVAYAVNTRWQGISLGSFKKNDKLAIDFAMRSNLGSGTYTVTPAIANSEADRFYDWWERACVFNVPGDETSQGVADLTAKITFKIKTDRA